MATTVQRVTRSVRSHLARLRDHIPRWSSWDSNEWQNGPHRRDPWR
jgi:hypothetical protein